MSSAPQGPRYRLLRSIKRGGTAEVFEALLLGDGGFERRVALKQLLLEIGGDESFQRSFADEARIAGQLHHSSIASVIDYGVADDRPFLVLEWIDGVDVRDVLDRATLPLPLALFVATEIAHALRHAHRAQDRQKRPLGIVHRDVSPENVLLSWEGDVKLTDFGIAWAKRRLEQTRVGLIKGRPAYMPPEQLRGDDVDRRTDLFALGCVLHEAITGRTPYGEEGPLGPAKIDPSLPGDVAEIIERATRKIPKERWASADEMSAALGRALAGRLDRDARTALFEWLSANVPPPELGPELDPPIELSPSGSERSYRTEASVVTEGPASASLEGRTIGSYVVHELLGKGGSARVYRATHSVIGREVAIKVLDSKLSEEPRALERFRREAGVLGRLAHPNIVSVHDFGELPDGRTFLVLELVPGRSLKDFIVKEAPLEPRRVAAIAQQIAVALAAAHEQGVLHRDLKPANVRVLASGDQVHVKILDFGIARSTDSDRTRLTVPGALLGTPSYVAPEQIKSSEAGPAADVYSLGVIVFEMLSGQRPFRGTVSEVLEAHLTKPAPPAPPAGGLEVWVDRMLSKDPVERPAAAELAAALSKIAAHESTAVTTVETRTAMLPQKGSDRDAGASKARVTAVARVIAGVLVLGAIGWFTTRSEERPGGGEPPAGVEPAPSPVVATAGPSEKAAAVETKAGERTAGETAPASAPAPGETAPASAPAPGETAPAETGVSETMPAESGARERPTAARSPRRGRSAPDPVQDSALRDLVKQVENALASSGIVAADLDGAGRNALAEFRRAKAARDLPSARSAAAALTTSLAAAPTGLSLLKKRLDRTGERLETSASRIPDTDRLELERRYLDLRSALGPKLDPARVTELSRAALELEAEIAKKER